MATVALHDAEATHLARFDGKRAVLVAVNMKEHQDLLGCAASSAAWWPGSSPRPSCRSCRAACC